MCIVSIVATCVVIMSMMVVSRHNQGCVSGRSGMWKGIWGMSRGYGEVGGFVVVGTVRCMNCNANHF